MSDRGITAACSEGVLEGDMMPVFCHRADMLGSFVVVGEFWEAGADSAVPKSVGIMSWEPFGSSRVDLVSLDGRCRISTIQESRGDPVCLHGRWLANVDGRHLGAAYFSVEATAAGGSERFGVYRRTERRYDVSSVWEGERLIIPSEAEFSQMGFSLCGLDKWIEHRPDISLRESGWGVLKDFTVGGVGDVCLLTGYEHEGINGESETLTAAHMWQIDFFSPRTWKECQDMLAGIAEGFSEMLEFRFATESLVLTEQTTAPSDADRFNVRLPQIISASESRKCPDSSRSAMNNMEDSRLFDMLAERISSLNRVR